MFKKVNDKNEEKITTLVNTTTSAARGILERGEAKSKLEWKAIFIREFIQAMYINDDVNKKRKDNYRNKKNEKMKAIHELYNAVNKTTTTLNENEINRLIKNAKDISDKKQITLKMKIRESIFSEGITKCINQSEKIYAAFSAQAQLRAQEKARRDEINKKNQIKNNLLTHLRKLPEYSDIEDKSVQMSVITDGNRTVGFWIKEQPTYTSVTQPAIPKILYIIDNNQLHAYPYTNNNGKLNFIVPDKDGKNKTLQFNSPNGIVDWHCWYQKQKNAPQESSTKADITLDFRKKYDAWTDDEKNALKQLLKEHPTHKLLKSFRRENKTVAEIVKSTSRQRKENEPMFYDVTINNTAKKISISHSITPFTTYDGTVWHQVIGADNQRQKIIGEGNFGRALYSSLAFRIDNEDKLITNADLKIIKAVKRNNNSQEYNQIEHETSTTPSASKPYKNSTTRKTYFSQDYKGVTCENLIASLEIDLSVTAFIQLIRDAALAYRRLGEEVAKKKGSTLVGHRDMASRNLVLTGNAEILENEKTVSRHIESIDFNGVSNKLIKQAQEITSTWIDHGRLVTEDDFVPPDGRNREPNEIPQDDWVLSTTYQSIFPPDVAPLKICSPEVLQGNKTLGDIKRSDAYSFLIFGIEMFSRSLPAPKIDPTQCANQVIENSNFIYDQCDNSTQEYLNYLFTPELRQHMLSKERWHMDDYIDLIDVRCRSLLIKEPLEKPAETIEEFSSAETIEEFFKECLYDNSQCRKFPIPNAAIILSNLLTSHPTELPNNLKELLNYKKISRDLYVNENYRSILNDMKSYSPTINRLISDENKFLTDGLKAIYQTIAALIIESIQPTQPTPSSFSNTSTGNVTTTTSTMFHNPLAQPPKVDPCKENALKLIKLLSDPHKLFNEKELDNNINKALAGKDNKNGIFEKYKTEYKAQTIASNLTVKIK